MVVTLQLTDYLGRLLANQTPGISDATDYLGRAVVANTGDPTDDTDYLGRLLHGFPPLTMTAPHGFWVWVPVYENPNIQTELTAINTRLDNIMAQVVVNTEDLEALDTALDAAATAIADKIAALQLPPADLAPLLEDVENLRTLGATVTPEQPPA